MVGKQFETALMAEYFVLFCVEQLLWLRNLGFAPTFKNY